jgi:hypothetical protein
MNDMKRREFLGRLGWFGSAIALAGLARLEPVWALTPVHQAAAGPRKEIMLNELTIGDFSPHLGGRFVLRINALQSIELELIEATPLGRKGSRPSHLAQREPFSIVFRASKGAALPQQIYHLEHEQMGGFDVFLVPIGMDKDGLRCEAIFN